MDVAANKLIVADDFSLYQRSPQSHLLLARCSSFYNGNPKTYYSHRTARLGRAQELLLSEEIGPADYRTMKEVCAEKLNKLQVKLGSLSTVTAQRTDFSAMRCKDNYQIKTLYMIVLSCINLLIIFT